MLRPARATHGEFGASVGSQRVPKQTIRIQIDSKLGFYPMDASFLHSRLGFRCYAPNLVDGYAIQHSMTFWVPDPNTFRVYPYQTPLPCHTERTGTSYQSQGSPTLHTRGNAYLQVAQSALCCT